MKICILCIGLEVNFLSRFRSIETYTAHFRYFYPKIQASHTVLISKFLQRLTSKKSNKAMQGIAEYLFVIFERVFVPTCPISKYSQSWHTSNLKWVWTLRSIFFPTWQNVSLQAVSDTSFCWEVLRSHVSKTGMCVYYLCYGRCRKRSGNTRVHRESLMTSQGYQQMAGVEQAVAEQRTRNVHPYQSEPVVPLPEPALM